MVANQVRFALQRRSWNRAQRPDGRPGDTRQVHGSCQATLFEIARSCSATVDPAMYSLTVNDITITDAQDHIILTLCPALPKTLDLAPKVQRSGCSRSDHQDARHLRPRQSVRHCRAAIRNGEPFLNVHVGVRTTLLQHVYEPSLQEAVTLMAFAAGTALIAAFLLSNLALRPMEEISMQLDFWNPLPVGPQSEGDEEPSSTRRKGSQPKSSRSDSASAMWRRSSLP